MGMDNHPRSVSHMCSPLIRIISCSFDHIAERASYVLEKAIDMPEKASSRLRYLIEAAQWLEYCLEYDAHLPTHTVKNSGLANVHLVRSRVDANRRRALPKVPDILGSKPILSPSMLSFEELHPRASGPEWKTWASERFSKAWGEFLNRTDATQDPQYSTIKDIYDTVITQAAARNQNEQK